MDRGDHPSDLSSNAPGDAIGEMSGLPALLVERPYLPGEQVELLCTWDYEEGAIQSAISGPGILALVPKTADLAELTRAAEAGEAIASAGHIIGRSRYGAVQVGVDIRFRITDLQLPPLPPLANGVGLEETGWDNPELVRLALDVRTLVQLVMLDRNQEVPAQLWTAPPDLLANLLAPVIFPVASAEWQAAFRLPTMAQLKMEHEWLTRQVAGQPQGSGAIDNPGAQPSRKPAPPLTESDELVEEFRQHFAGLAPDLLVQVERRVRACVGDRDGQDRDLAFIKSMPLTTRVQATRSIRRARSVLIRELGEVDSVGECLLERIAERSRRPHTASASFGRPLLLAGEAGTGKTLRAEVIARALGLPCHTLPLAGLSDALSVRGLRALYTRSQPGIIAEALAATQSMTCCLVLDELDKMDRGWHHGDPADALLHAVDPRQARAFRDDFLEFPLDLSGVLFIATVNDPSAVPHTLLDRFQQIEVPPYTRLQKGNIVSLIMLPALRREYALGPGAFEISRGALEALLDRHDLEPGLRQMENSLNTLAIRAAARLGAGVSRYRVGVTDVAELAGGAQFEDHDQCAICGSHILEPSDGVRFLGGELPASAVDPGVPLTAHRLCLGRPTTYFLSHRHEIEARVAAESVIWRWMTGPREDEGPAGGSGAGVNA